MNWYLAKLRFQLIGGQHASPMHWDEQWCLIPAVSSAEAFNRADNIGRKKQDCFLDPQRKWVQRQFVRVSEITLLGHLLKGICWHSHSDQSLAIASPQRHFLTIVAAPRTRLMLHTIVYTLVRTSIRLSQFWTSFFENGTIVRSKPV